MTNRISAVINTFNEEENISFCLAGLCWCDEIIVVDMESTDNTVALCRKYTEKIFTFQNVRFADPAREFAVSQATGDWILVIDADEIVPASLAGYLKEIASNSNSKDVYWIPLKNYLFGKWIQNTGWGFPDYHCRFFKKGSIQFSSEIHNFMTPRGSQAYLPSSSEYALHHFNYVNITGYIEKLNRYSVIEAEQRYGRGKRFSIFFFMIRVPFEFFRRYFFQRGFLDGWRGFVLSVLVSFYSAVINLRLLELEGGSSEEIVHRQHCEMKSSIINSFGRG